MTVGQPWNLYTAIMKLVSFVLFILLNEVLVEGFFTSSNPDDDISSEICGKLCKNGKVFNSYTPPKAPDCGSYISCKKCNYNSIIKKNDPSAVCSFVFSNEFEQSDKTTQKTLLYGKSQLIIPHSSTFSNLSRDSNVLDPDKGDKKHGLFTVAVDWKRIKGADISQCYNGIAEIEWSIFNTGIYRNWDIVAIIETKPEATFPFCHENVKYPLDTTRSTNFGRRLPTNLKRLGYSIANGRPSAIRLTKIIAVNQKEMKMNPEKTIKLLLDKYVSFKIGVNGISVKQIYSESFSDHNYSKVKKESLKQSSDSNNLNESFNSGPTSIDSSDKYMSGENPIEYKNKTHQKKVTKLDNFKEKLIDKLRGKGYTDPLILDSLLSLGFYSCFRIICSEKKMKRSRGKTELSPRIPLPLETAKEIHLRALREFTGILPKGHLIPLPIYNSEYWVYNGPHKTSSSHPTPLALIPSFVEFNDQHLPPNSKNESLTDISDDEEDEGSDSEESSSSSSLLDLLTMIALTNSETIQNSVNIDKIVDSESQ
ncbi:signal peptide protein [Cryptosporidium felis]|nr:signal peptide protein [Cryptosporidium felis]